MGDSGVLIVLEGRITKQINRSVMALHRYLQENRFPGMTESVPAYCTLAVFFDPLVITYEAVVSELQNAASAARAVQPAGQRTIEVPVVYGGEYGPDLDDLARLKGITAEEIVKLHAGSEYTVGMIGFYPGFPYLIGLPEKLAAPRKLNPRKRVPAGSVGIAGQQTGIYPRETPGGWQIIGRTPLVLFNIHRPRPFLFQTGDRVIFRPVSPREFNDLVKMGDCVC
jgi:inhibitor of KinA